MRTTFSALAMSVFALGASIAAAAPSRAATGTQLADGSSLQYGTLSNGLQWQASGKLYKGGCPSAAGISDCYELDLVSDPNSELDTNHLDSPRQRIEFRAPNQADGAQWKYKWYSYVPTTEKSGSNFFHLMQIFDNAQHGPIFTLDLRKNSTAQVLQYYPSQATLQSVDQSQYLGKKVLNEVIITFGPNGSFDYFAQVAGTKILHVQKSNIYVSSGSGYLKFGTYRKTFTGMGASQAFMGDFSAEKLN